MSSAPDTTCVALANALAEPIAGTAAVAQAWLCIEDRSAWQAKAFKGLAKNDRDAIKTLETRVQNHVPARAELRLQGIRRPGRKGPLALFAMLDGRLFTTEFESYDALRVLDVESWLDRTQPKQSQALLYLVCTHGKRDVCCARDGIPYYRALDTFLSTPHRVWQTTHVGGHRFAPNVVTLPDGFSFGRLSLATLNTWVNARERGEIGALEHLRGDSALASPVQFAAVSLRKELKLITAQAFQHITILTHESTHCEVEFRVDNAVHRVRVASTPGPPQIKSCGDPPKPTVRYQVVRKDPSVGSM